MPSENRTDEYRDPEQMSEKIPLPFEVVNWLNSLPDNLSENVDTLKKINNQNWLRLCQ
jgi:hypothetical protein